LVSFKTKSGERVSFKAGSRKKKKSNMPAKQRRALSRAAKARPRIKSGPRKGQFK